jgi:hypothetical protein
MHQHKHRPRRRLHALALIAALLGAAPAAAAAAPEDVKVPAAAQLDAGPPAATAPPASSPPVTVDPSAGTVTPTQGTIAAQAEAHPTDVAKQAIEDARGGRWRLAIAGALALVMVAGVRWGGRLFGRTDRGKAIAIMVLSLLGALSTSLATHLPLDLKLVTGAIGLAWMAVGGRKWLSSVLWPRDGGSAWAAWLKPWLGVDQPPKPPA